MAAAPRRAPGRRPAGIAAVALVCLSLVGTTRAGPIGNPDALTFAVIGNWGWQNAGQVFSGLGPTDNQPAYATAQKVVAAALGTVCGYSKYNCDAVIAAGDNFNDLGVTGASDAQWTSSFQNVYNAPPLLTNAITGKTVPFYAVLGEHDYGFWNATGSSPYSAAAQFSTGYGAVDPTGRWVMDSPGFYARTLTSASGVTSVALTFADTPALNDAEVGCVRSNLNYTMAVPRYNTSAAGGWPALADASSVCRFTSPALQMAGSALRRAVQGSFLQASLAAGQCATWSAGVGHHAVASPHVDTMPLLQTAVDAITGLTGNQPVAWFSGHDRLLAHVAPPVGRNASGYVIPASLSTNFFASGAAGAADWTDLVNGTSALLNASSALQEWASANSGFAVVTATPFAFTVDMFDLGGSPRCPAGGLAGVAACGYPGLCCNTTYTAYNVTAPLVPAYSITYSTPQPGTASQCATSAASGTGTGLGLVTGSGSSVSITVAFNPADVAGSAKLISTALAQITSQAGSSGTARVRASFAFSFSSLSLAVAPFTAAGTKDAFVGAYNTSAGAALGTGVAVGVLALNPGSVVLSSQATWPVGASALAIAQALSAATATPGVLLAGNPQATAACGGTCAVQMSKPTITVVAGPQAPPSPPPPGYPASGAAGCPRGARAGAALAAAAVAAGALTLLSMA